MSALCLCNAYRVFLNMLLIEEELFLKDRYFDFTVKFKPWRLIGLFMLTEESKCVSGKIVVVTEMSIVRSVYWLYMMSIFCRKLDIPTPWNRVFLEKLAVS